MKARGQAKEAGLVARTGTERTGEGGGSEREAARDSQLVYRSIATVLHHSSKPCGRPTASFERLGLA